VVLYLAGNADLHDLDCLSLAAGRAPSFRSMVHNLRLEVNIDEYDSV
jgi:hypothetical protein